ncbi:MauE/DoxX family redox-associated membrane protein [Thermomonospora umbrina]|uniref:Putative membrane protein YphA (DoxX/SURF4 family) n=1 Tax=Thermomonospora umbrina TaxID=111806 RepID=A0A3D9SVY7_9ACTN|nr:MauE/DoxX family redox-associated membrane protein [Thermomonospora umbrina]REE99757.1 putative membrane protein YphA (DoxX/SURF4 family) [Thermomonospora umbrina]
MVTDKAEGGLTGMEPLEPSGDAPAAARSTPSWPVAALVLALPVLLSWTAWAEIGPQPVGIAGGLATVLVLAWAARSARADQLTTTAARVGLAVVLGWAGLAKAAEPPALQELAVEAYRLLPDGMITPVGIGLPILEIVLAALLLAGFATRFTAALSGLLMVVFIIGIASAWARGLKIDCGCFGGGGEIADPPYLGEILRDLGFLALAAWITVWPPGRYALDRKVGLYED